ncbi:hypothetical protein AAE250_02860 [Bacteroides sp. GD17]|jgi:hypothetical protein|uniref:hypothetical protein n=1 Tax=Bacteroides sp. GD17 TaxID=3139826 RepID=UPI00313C33CC
MKNIFFTLSFILFVLAANAGNEQTNDVLGPYSMSNNLPTPEGYARVVITSTPEFTGGSITLLNQDTGGSIVLHGSVTYMSIWFYFIPSGTYVVESIANGYSAVVNADGVVSVGSTVTFYKSGHVGFTVIDNSKK